MRLRASHSTSCPVPLTDFLPEAPGLGYIGDCTRPAFNYKSYCGRLSFGVSESWASALITSTNHLSEILMMSSGTSELLSIHRAWYGVIPGNPTGPPPLAQSSAHRCVSVSTPAAETDLDRSLQGLVRCLQDTPAVPSTPTCSSPPVGMAWPGSLPRAPDTGHLQTRRFL